MGSVVPEVEQREESIDASSRRALLATVAVFGTFASLPLIGRLSVTVQ